MSHPADPAVSPAVSDLDITVRMDMGALLPASKERAGDVIARYELVKVLGQGGFGTVWLARQSEPIRRDVALKLIKPGMDSREILTRFEAEKQTLALMDHPNIAGVLDAGTTQDGRPYFVMELIKGVPITEYCDRNNLGIRQRLELFIPVCQAVQHAHQKAVLHRDLKPSNILVEEVDGRAIPRVIDFGIAKALGGSQEQMSQSDLARTLEGSVIGTPQYMSPEQAGAKSDIDTRSDIYTLGVILYELLTGTTPLTRERLLKTAFDEMLRLVREQEAQRPSSRIMPLSADQTRTCTALRTEPAKLTRTLRGDLDWITLKALEKDRERRYESANALAEDIRRHLNQEPVSAAAPGVGYRLTKLVRRNRGTFAAAAAIVGVLIGATIVSVRQAARAMRAERAARDALRTAEHHRNEAQQNLAGAREAVGNYLNRVTDHPRLKQADFLDLRSQLLETALPFYERFVQQQSDDPELRKEQVMALGKLAHIYVSTGQMARAEALYQHAQTAGKNLPSESKHDPVYQRVVSAISSDSSKALSSQGKNDEAESTLLEALATQEKLVAQTPQDAGLRGNLALTLNRLGRLCVTRGRAQEAEAYFRRAVENGTLVVAERPGDYDAALNLAGVHNNLGNLLHKTGRVNEAAATAKMALDIIDGLNRHAQPSVDVRHLQATIHAAVGSRQRELGRIEEALHSCQKAGSLFEALVAEFPGVLDYRNQAAATRADLSVVLGDMGRFVEAEKEVRKAIEQREQLAAQFPEFADARDKLASSYNGLGVFLGRQRRFLEAEQAHRKAREISSSLVRQHPDDPDHLREFADACNCLGILLADQGRPAEAAPEFRKALELREQHLRDFPEVRPNRVELAGAWHNLAMTLDKDPKTQAEARALYQKAIALQREELAHNPQSVVSRRYLRNHLGKSAELCLAQGDHASAITNALELAQNHPDSSMDQINASRYIVRCVPLVEKDTALTEAERPEVLELVARQSIEMLRQALALGFNDLNKVRADPVFAPLLQRADFQELSQP